MLLRRTTVGAILAILVMLVAVACGGDSDSPSSPSTAQPTSGGGSNWQGGIVEPPFQMPDVVLTDTNGERFDLRAETDGHYTLLYIGYTHCPDICPMHMADISDTLKALPAEQSEQVKVIFVTADPKRDTPEVIRKWLDNFDTEFIGLTGTDEEIADFHAQLSMPPPKTTDLGDGNYAVSHAAFVFAYTPDNQAHLVIPSGFTLEQWKHDLDKLTSEGWTGA